MTMTKKMLLIFGCAALALTACNGKSADDDSADLQSCEGADCDDGGDESDGGDGSEGGGGSDGGDGGDGESDGDGSDGAEECEVALDCAYACDPDEACALECAETVLNSEREAAFEALVTCMVDAGCGINEECLDASCESEFRVFDELCT
jgi:hypothetical protein